MEYKQKSSLQMNTASNDNQVPAEGPHIPEKMVSHVGGSHFHKGFLGIGDPGHYFPKIMGT